MVYKTNFPTLLFMHGKTFQVAWIREMLGLSILSRFSGLIKENDTPSEEALSNATIKPCMHGPDAWSTEDSKNDRSIYDRNTFKIQSQLKFLWSVKSTLEPLARINLLSTILCPQTSSTENIFFLNFFSKFRKLVPVIGKHPVPTPVQVLIILV